jgi:HK97 family phage major capsid protein
VTDVRSANAVPNALIWAPRTAGGVAKLAKDSQGNYFPLPSPLAELAKFQTTAIPINITKGTLPTATELYFGDFTQLLVGLRMQLGIQLLREVYAATGEYAFNAWMRADIQLEHGPAFSVITDSST